MYRRPVIDADTKLFIAWYKRAQWPRLRALSDEPDKLAETYDEWLASANAQLAELRARGLAVRKVIVDVEELAAWCRRQGRKVEPSAAAAFAATLAEQGRGLLDW